MKTRWWVTWLCVWLMGLAIFSVITLENLPIKNLLVWLAIAAFAFLAYRLERTR